MSTAPTSAVCRALRPSSSMAAGITALTTSRLCRRPFAYPVRRRSRRRPPRKARYEVKTCDGDMDEDDRRPVRPLLGVPARPARGDSRRLVRLLRIDRWPRCVLETRGPVALVELEHRVERLGPPGHRLPRLA